MSLPVLESANSVCNSLLEKQRTVPASYPLSLNSLRLACNQTSSRDPVVDYSERTIQDTARSLKDKGLLRLVWAGAGSRTVKYHQLLDEVLSLQDSERALLTVLLLRGAQAPGELKTRTDRLHAFVDRGEVEACLARMAAAEPPLVRELPLQRGRDRRWIHLLGPVPGATETAAPIDLDTVLAMDPRPATPGRGRLRRRRRGLLAAVPGRVDRKPFDVWLLERIADAAGGPILDVGCGRVDLGVPRRHRRRVHGLDASEGMIEQRANFPDLDFQVGRFEQILRPRDAAAWGAIICWYAFVHLASSELQPTLRAAVGTLRPGGVLALALHVGQSVLHTEEFLGATVGLDFVLHDRDQVLAAMQGAGLVVDEWYERSPWGQRLTPCGCTSSRTGSSRSHGAGQGRRDRRKSSTAVRTWASAACRLTRARRRLPADRSGRRSCGRRRRSAPGRCPVAAGPDRRPPSPDRPPRPVRRAG